MAYQLSDTSLKRLDGVHPHLIMVVKRAIELTDMDFGVAEGVRDIHRQKKLLGLGKTQTLNSKHLPQWDGFSHAVDLYAWHQGKAHWDFAHLRYVAQAMFLAAAEQEVKIRAGILWKNSWDSPHFELVEMD